MTKFKDFEIISFELIEVNGKRMESNRSILKYLLYTLGVLRNYKKIEIVFKIVFKNCLQKMTLSKKLSSKIKQLQNAPPLRHLSGW